GSTAVSQSVTPQFPSFRRVPAGNLPNVSAFPQFRTPNDGLPHHYSVSWSGAARAQTWINDTLDGAQYPGQTVMGGQAQQTAQRTDPLIFKWTLPGSLTSPPFGTGSIADLAVTGGELINFTGYMYGSTGGLSAIQIIDKATGATTSVEPVTFNIVDPPNP